MPDPATLPTTDAEGLQNISDKGKPPPSRLADYKSAAAIVKQLILEDEPDRQDRMNEEALLGGQGPFIQSELDAAGQSWRQNNDWGGASTKFEQAQAPYYDLLNGFTTEFDETVQGVQLTDYSARFGESWTNLHTRIWEEHAFQDQNLTRLFVGFGVAVADHEHPKDWRWRSGGMGEHYFPRPMQAFANAANIHVRVREFAEHELFRYYSNTVAEKVGWNKEEIKKAMLACNTSATNRSDYWDSIQNNIFGVTLARRASVRVFTMRVVEMTDQGEMVSECMGLADGSGGDFIYKSKKPQWLDQMGDAFTLFTAGIGNGYLHSIKGLARKVFNTSQTENQFINQMFDFARIYMSPMFESDDANAMQKLARMEVSLFNLIPKGLKLVPATAAPNYAQSILPLLGFSAQLGAQATGIYQQQMTPASVEQTKEEVVQRTIQNAVLTSAAITLHTAAKERQYNSSLKRLQNRNYSPGSPGYKERKAWLADLARKGVPEEAIYHAVHIKPNRQVGGGSAAVGQLLLEKAAGLRPYLDPIGQKTLDEMMLTRLLGSENAKVLMPTIGIQRTSESQRFAMDENGFMLLGVPKPVLPDDDHFQHAQIHDAALPDVELKFSRGQIQPPAMLQFLNLFIPHQKAHLQALHFNKPQAGLIGQFSVNLNKAVQTQEHLTNSAQAEQNRLAQNAQAQADRERLNPQSAPSGVTDGQQRLAVRAQEAQLDINATAAKAGEELRQRQAEHQQDLQHADEKHRQEMAFDDVDQARETLRNTPPAAPPPPAS